MLFNLLCGYGEKPLRVVASSLVIIGVYTSFYKVFDLIVDVPTGKSLNWLDSLYFSAATFCTLTFSDFLPQARPIARLLTTSEAFMGVFILSLFVFTLTKKYVSR